MHLTNSKRYILWIVSVWGYIFSLINILEKSFIEEDFSIFGRHYAKTWKELKFSNCSYLRIKDTSLFRNGLKLSLKEFLSYYFCQRAIFSKSWTQLILNRSMRDIRPRRELYVSLISYSWNVRLSKQIIYLITLK